MQGDSEVIKQLNMVLTQQLTAINQYFLHSRMLEDWGYTKIAEKVYEESIRQMKAAREITDRILFLEGLPNYQKLLKLSIGESPEECLKNDLGFCAQGHSQFASAIQLTLDKQDHVSRELLEDILEHEEAFIDWLEVQQSIIQKVGLENYLAEKM